MHRRRSIRLREYDYSRPGAYFATICARSAMPVQRGRGLGDGLERGGSDGAGGVDRLPRRFPGIEVEPFVVMPNHVHGIVVLTGDRRGESCIRPESQGFRNQGEHEVRPYGTLAGTVGRIVQAFKSATTVEYIRGVEERGWPPFRGRLWQRDYYEHVIRDERDWQAIREYIVMNPAQWEQDAEHPNPRTR